MAAKTFAKFASTFGVGASAGYICAVMNVEELLIKPPTFANLEPKPQPKLRDIEWGPVVQWDYNWDQRDYEVIFRKFQSSEMNASIHSHQLAGKSLSKNSVSLVIFTLSNNTTGIFWTPHLQKFCLKRLKLKK